MTKHSKAPKYDLQLLWWDGGWQWQKKYLNTLTIMQFTFVSFSFCLTLSKCVCPIVSSRWCMHILGELETEGGGGGNIKQRFGVLSSHCLDRTPPHANEVFVCQYQFHFLFALRYTHLGWSLLSSWDFNRHLKVNKEVTLNYPRAAANAERHLSNV